MHQVFGVHQVRSQVSAPLLVASYSPLLACTSLPSWFKEQSILLDASARLNRVECQAKKTSRNSTQSKKILQRYLWRLLQRATNVPPMYQCRKSLFPLLKSFHAASKTCRTSANSPHTLPCLALQSLGQMRSNSTA